MSISRAASICVYKFSEPGLSKSSSVVVVGEGAFSKHCRMVVWRVEGGAERGLCGFPASRAASLFPGVLNRCIVAPPDVVLSELEGDQDVQLSSALSAGDSY